MVRPKFFCNVAILAGIAMFVIANPAEATLRLRLDVGGVGVVITDGGAGDSNPTSGAVTFSGSIGGFIVNVTTGTSQPPLPLNSSAFSQIDLNSVNVAGAGAGTMVITLIDDGFSGGAPGALLVNSQVGGTLSGTGSTVTFQSWANGGNAVPGIGVDVGPPSAPIAPFGGIPLGSTAVFSPGPLAFGVGAFAGSGSAGFISGPMYSLFSQAVITFGSSGGSVSFNHLTSTTPEPATVLSAIFGVPALGYWIRRRKVAQELAA